MPATREAGGGALTNVGLGGSVIDSLEEDGFDGLEFGFGAFPMVTLQNTGIFELSDGGPLGQDFYCIILGSKAKWIVKNDQKGPLEDFAYTFDKIHTTSGGLIEDKTAEWAAKGWGHEMKKYLDVQAQLVTQDQHNGELVLLSIPPTSVNKFSGYLATVQGRYAKRVKNVITRCHLGDRVTKVKYPFHPWAFTYYGDAT